MLVRGQLDTSAITRVFGELRARAKDLRDPLEQIGPTAQAGFQRAFDQEGPGWAPNSGRNPVGYKTGDMERSYTRRGATGNVWVVTPDGASFGSALPYSKTFHEGGEVVLPSGRRITVPARPVVRNPAQEFTSRLGQLMAKRFTIKDAR